MENKVLKWQIYGFVFISILGSFDHFLFEFSGYFYPVGPIAAVNESVWEHLKLAYWPLVLFASIEYRYIKEESKNFLLAVAVAAYVMPIYIIIVFYSYTAITGHSILAVDLLTFYSCVFIGQYLSFKILILRELPKSASIISLILILLLGVIFVLFTYFPPHCFIFQDGLTGEYGILTHYDPIFVK